MALAKAAYFKVVAQAQSKLNDRPLRNLGGKRGNPAASGRGNVFPPRAERAGGRALGPKALLK